MSENLVQKCTVVFDKNAFFSLGLGGGLT